MEVRVHARPQLSEAAESSDSGTTGSRPGFPSLLPFLSSYTPYYTTAMSPKAPSNYQQPPTPHKHRGDRSGCVCGEVRQRTLKSTASGRPSWAAPAQRRARVSDTDTVGALRPRCSVVEHGHRPPAVTARGGESKVRQPTSGPPERRAPTGSRCVHTKGGRCSAHAVPGRFLAL